MSDDDEYYDWEEEYLLEDLVPDFVDELAQTSYYEAALYEDPAIDVEDYYSDWEYYSDDYYDDDPTVKHPATTKSKTTNSSSPAKKSRRAHAQTSPQTNPIARLKSSAIPDKSSFQSVIWKTPSLDPNQDVAVFYEPIGDKVALLKDWREVFKSAQPALDKSRLRKRKVREGEEEGGFVPTAEMSFADDEFPCDGDDEDDRLDSSERMSDIVSTGNMSENGDAGEASNTTPEFMQSPKKTPTSTPAKRGRKRKAEVPAEETVKNNPGVDSTRTRSKRVASRKVEGESKLSGASTAPTRSKRVASRKVEGESKLSGASTAPTRRSTRQKK